MAPEDQGSAWAESCVLPDVPRIGYGIHTCPLPGSLFSILQYLGDPHDYAYLMGISGAAFRRLWHRDDGGNVDLSYLAPEVYQHLADGIHHELRPVPRDREQMLAAIRTSLNQGRPLVAFGIIGPPEAGIVTGYDQGGEVLRGWSYFQDGGQTEYYEESDWFARFVGSADAMEAGLGPVERQPGLLVVGDKSSPPHASRRDTLIASLHWAVDLTRTAHRPNLPNHVSGLAAYEGWAAGFAADEDYPADDAEIMGRRVMVHGDQAMMLYERAYAAAYLRLMLDVAGEAAEHLAAAAELYDRVHALGDSVWLWGHSMGPEVGEALVSAETRAQIAHHIREAGALEEQAVTHLEAALAALA